MPSYFIADTKVSYEFLANTLIYMQMKNVFDKEYLTAGTGSTIKLEVPNRGRETFIGLDMSF